MRVEQIEVGKTYERMNRTHMVVFAMRDGTAKYIVTTHTGTVIGENSCPVKDFARWAVREVPHAN